MFSKRFGLSLAVLGAPFLVSSAFADGWTVAKISGQGWIVSETQPAVPVVAGATVSPGSTIATGPNGRAMLVHGQDTMLLGPGTKIAVPYRPDSGLDTTVFQQTGSVDLSIEHLAVPHFSVQTPYLAAVVKGTMFNVTVADGSANVSVKRGVVGVSDLKTGERSDVAAGQSAGVSSVDGGGLKVGGKKGSPQVRAGKPQKSVVAPTPAQAKVQALEASVQTPESAAVAGVLDVATPVGDASLAAVSPSDNTSASSSKDAGEEIQAVLMPSRRNSGHGLKPHNDPSTSPPGTSGGDSGVSGDPVPPEIPPTTSPGLGGLAGWLERHHGWSERERDWLNSHPGWLQSWLEHHAEALKDNKYGKGRSGKGNKGKNGGKSGKSGKGKSGKSGD